MDQMLLNITSTGQSWFGVVWPLLWTLVKIVLIVLPIMGCVAYLTLWERKMIGWMHVRIGPNRTGPAGLLQPIADALKLLLKEIIVPAKASKALFVIAPIMTIMPALAEKLVVIEGDMVKVSQGSGSAVLEVGIDQRLPDSVVRVATAHPSTQALGGMFGEVRVEKA